jgi:DNA-binding response OmpR family regulator
MAILFSRRTGGAAPPHIRRLLVVEDDALVAFDHEYDLKSAGYDVVATVGSGEAAVPVLAEGDVDAIILDLHLAGAMQGRDIARLAHDRGIAVLLVSGDEPDPLIAAYAFGHLAKPTAKRALVGALRAMDTLLCDQKTPRPVPGLTIWAGQDMRR